MSQVNPYSNASVASPWTPAALADESARASFIRRTYAHLAGAVLAFLGIEVVLFGLVPEPFMRRVVASMTGGYMWLVVLGAFMGIGWLARSWASSGASRSMQYTGLALYVVAEAVIFLPILYIAVIVMGQPQIPVLAGIITFMTFAGLTAFVFTTKVDLASWGKYLCIAGLVAMGMIVCGILFGFSLGLFFSAAMVALAAGYILYDTSNVLHHYSTDQHVAASLALFASVAFLFWYVLRLVMAFSSSD
ncbi:MAG: Bax inhibitor-1 family protein [Planctomycetota bacterium]